MCASEDGITRLCLARAPTIMGKKDKKKNPDRKTRVAEKTSRKLASKEKKASKKGASGEGVDPDDVDIDTVLAEYARQVL